MQGLGRQSSWQGGHENYRGGYLHHLHNAVTTRMWVDAQHDGCPAEYRWCNQGAKVP